MDFELFKSIVKKTLKSELISNMFFISGFGESMLHPQFWDMIYYARRNGIAIVMPTNGTLLDEEAIKKARIINSLQISCDSLNDSRFEDLSYLLNRYGVSWQLNVTVGSHNIDELDDFIQWGIRNNVPVYLMYTNSFDGSDPDLVKECEFCLDHESEIITKSGQYFGGYTIDRGCNSFANCRYFNNDFAIDWEGNLFPCNDALLRKYKFAHVDEYDNFDQYIQSEIWQNVKSGKHPICDICKQWDVRKQSIRNQEIYYDKRLDEYHNKHRGEKCFVIGAGPSFTKEVADAISNEISIGVNRIGHAKEMWGFEPTYACFADYEGITKDESKYCNQFINCPTFFPKLIYSQIARDGKIFTEEEKYILNNEFIPVNWINPSIGADTLTMPAKEYISFDLRVGILESGTVIQGIAIPLAAWLGCSEIYLVGCDCDTSPRFYGADTDNLPVPRWGMDIFRQYQWLAERLEEDGKMLYSISNNTLLGIKKVTLKEALSHISIQNEKEHE